MNSDTHVLKCSWSRLLLTRIIILFKFLKVSMSGCLLLILFDKSLESSGEDKKEMFSPKSRAVLMGMIDSHIARWIDQNLPEFLEDSLPSSEPRARDAKVKHRS